MANLETLAKEPNTMIGEILVDACVSESHSFDVDVTEYPVEKGPNISDHARSRPDRLTLECYISNTPYTQAAIQDALEKQGETGVGRARGVMIRLYEYKSNATVLDVVTPLAIYENMVIESINVTRDSTTGDGLNFSANFKRIRVVSNKAVVVIPANPKRGKKKVNKGNQSAKAKSDAEKDEAEYKYRSTWQAVRQDNLLNAGKQWASNIGL